MFEPYRRDAISKSLFHIAEILIGAAFISVWLSPAHLLIKIATVIVIVLILFLAIVVCPTKSPERK